MPDPVYTTNSPPMPPGTFNPDAPTLGNYYCTVQDVFKHCLGVPWKLVQRYLDEYAAYSYPDAATVDALLGNHLIADAESFVDGLCLGTYKPTQVTRFFDGSGTNEMLLPRRPVIALAECVMYAIPSVVFYTFVKPHFIESLGDVNSATDYEDADLLIDGASGILRIPTRVLYANLGTPFWDYTFIGGANTIKVVWTYGFQNGAAVPQTLKEATALCVGLKALEICGIIDGGGTASYRTENFAKVYGREKTLPYGDLIARWDGRIKKLLQPFRHVG